MLSAPPSDICADNGNERALNEMEILILSQLYAYVSPNEPIPSPQQLQELSPAILARLQQSIQQGISPPPLTVELLNQLQQLYILKDTLVASRKTSLEQVNPRNSIVHSPDSSMLTETKIIESVQPARGRGRTNTRRGGKRAESPVRAEPSPPPLLSAAQQGRLNLFPMYAGKPPGSVSPGGEHFAAAPPAAKITSILSDTNLRNLLKGLQQAPDTDVVDILDFSSLLRFVEKFYSSE